MVSTGTCTIAANQPGDATYAAAAEVTQSVQIIAAGGTTTQTITFDAQSPAQQTFLSGGTFTLNPPASADSGLAIVYSSKTPGVCTVDASSGDVTMVSTGTCTIAANQPGDATYAAAAEVTQSVAIKDLTTMTLTASPNPARSNQQVTLTATVYGDPPTGIVTFYDANGTITLGTASLSPVDATSSQATFTVGPFTAGSIHALSASYEGDGINVSSTSKVVTLAILRSSGPGVTVSVPALGGWALLVLAAMLGWVAIRRMGKQQF
jgi:hypothetical protein